MKKNTYLIYISNDIITLWDILIKFLYQIKNKSNIVLIKKTLYYLTKNYSYFDILKINIIHWDFKADNIIFNKGIYFIDYDTISFLDYYVYIYTFAKNEDFSILVIKNIFNEKNTKFSKQRYIMWGMIFNLLKMKWIITN
jgi:thiamine kinase-like enzyme